MKNKHPNLNWIIKKKDNFSSHLMVQAYDLNTVGESECDRENYNILTPFVSVLLIIAAYSIYCAHVYTISIVPVCNDVFVRRDAYVKTVP